MRAWETDMSITQIYSGEDGESHFSEFSNFFDENDVRMKTQLYPAVGWDIGIGKPGWVADWHVARVPRVLIVLEGILEVEVGSGEIRQFEKGDVLVAKDTTGKGHISRVAGNKPLTTLTIPMETG